MPDYPQPLAEVNRAAGACTRLSRGGARRSKRGSALLFALAADRGGSRSPALTRGENGTIGSVLAVERCSAAFHDDFRANLPAAVCEAKPGAARGADGKVAFDGLKIFDASIERGFQDLGGVAHGKAGAACRSWRPKAASRVKRSVVIGQQVFSITADGMRVQNLARLGTDIANIPLGR